MAFTSAADETGQEILDVDDTVHTPASVHTVWCDTDRGLSESRMSFETALHLRLHLTEDFSSASCWSDLIDRLAAKGFHLAFQDDKLVLNNNCTGTSICTCRYLGFSFKKLARSFGKPSVLAGCCQLVPPA